MNHATPNLPTRDVHATARFYEALGFTVRLKTENWMILNRGGIQLEFFPMPDHEPRESCFSASVRVDNLDALYADFLKVGLPIDGPGFPCMSGPPRMEPYGLRLFELIDPEGNLLRCSDNATGAGPREPRDL